MTAARNIRFVAGVVTLLVAATRCEELITCDSCQEHPLCGWCDDGNNQGIGQCMQGALTGPVRANGSVNTQYCPRNRWYFADCPREQTLFLVLPTAISLENMENDLQVSVV